MTLFKFLMFYIPLLLLAREFVKWAVRKQFHMDHRRRGPWPDDGLSTDQRLAELQRRADFDQESG